MSYHRGEPYVWNDGEEMHLWSNLRSGDVGYACAVRIPLPIFDEIVVRRFADLMRERRVPKAILRAVREIGGKFEQELLKAARQKPEAEVMR